MMVIAGAGSGKTRSLVSRYIYLLIAEFNETDSILALTYTNKAAAEMRERIRDILYKIYYTDEAAEPIRELLKEHLGDDGFKKKAFADLIGADTAYMGTFHGFANSLINAMPIEFKVSPDAILTDEAMDAVILQQSSERVMQRILKQKNDLDMGILLLSTDMTLNDIVASATRILNCWHNIGRTTGLYDHCKQLIQDYLEMIEVRDVKAKEAELISAIANFDAARLTDTENIEIFSRMSRIAKEYDSSEGAVDIFLSMSLGRIDLKISREAKGAKEEKKYFRQMEEYLADLGNLVDIERALAMAHLADRINTEVMESRERNNILTFSRMLELLEGRLKSDKDFTEILRKKYSNILVDEYQDANSQQRDIIYLLSGNSGEHQIEETRFDETKLFIVGDPKQSIYYFRNADVSVFNWTADHFKAKGYEVSEFADNYRSAPSLIKYYNPVFSQALVHDEEIPYSVDFGKPLEAKKKEVKDSGVFFTKVEDVHRETALRIQKLIKSGYGYSDIAILLRAVSGKLEPFILALEEYSIPYTVDKDKTLGSYDLLRSIIKYLKALTNPYDDMAFLAFLKSGLFYADDPTLLDISEEEGDTLYDKARNFFSKSLAEGDQKLRFRIFAKLNISISEDSIESVINNIITENNIGELIDASESPKELTFGIERLREIALQLELKNVLTIYDYVKYIEDNLNNIHIYRKDIENVERINIITVHSSKGLEYPIVIYPQFKKHRGVTSSIYLDRDSYAFRGSKLKLSSNDFFNTYMNKVKSKEEYEFYRLLYVAYTRAEDRLYVISEKLKDTELSIFQEWVEEAPLEDPSIRKPSKTGDMSVVSPKYISYPKYPEVMTISQYLEKNIPIVTSDTVIREDSGEGDRNLGNLVHRMLQYKRYWDIYVSDEEAVLFDKAKKIFSKYQESPLFSKYEEDETGFREVDIQGYYEGNSGKVLLYGRIDRLIMAPTPVVIDYKTSISPAMMQRDKQQVRIYCALLRKKYKNIRGIILDLSEMKELSVN